MNPVVCDVEEFRRLWTSGATCAEIAAHFKGSRAWASKKAQALGLARRLTPQGVLPLRSLAVLYEQGASLQGLRRQLLPVLPKISASTIREALRASGVKIRERGGQGEIPVADVVRMHRAGLTNGEIHRRTGWSRSGIGKIVRKMCGKRPSGGSRPRFSHSRMWAMLRAGCTPREIANEFGVTVQAIHWHRRRAGMAKRRETA